MFRRKRTKCPITKEDKEWVVEHLDWIHKNLFELIEFPTILPTREFFDIDFTGTEEDAKYLLDRIGQLAKINTVDLKLNFYSEEPLELDRGLVTQKEEGSGSAGIFAETDDDFEIWIEVRQLKNPSGLIATIAHELTHFCLIAEKDINLEGEENEWFTDLVTIALGFGIFLGNVKFEFSQWQSDDGWGGWQYSSLGYLPEKVIAYAMADIETMRSNEIPEWTKFLKPDIKKDFIQSMEYIWETQNQEK